MSELKIVPARDMPKFQTENTILVGPAGGGKSTLTATMPGNSLVLAFDVSARPAYQKVDVGQVDIVEVLPEQQDLTPYTMKDMKNPPPPAQGQKKELGRQFLDAGAFLNKAVASGIIPGKYQNIITDSVTTLQALALDAVMAKEGRSGHIPQMTDYVAMGRLIESWFDTICRLPMNAFFLVHDEMAQDEVTKRIIYQPLLSGKAKQRIPTKVNHMLRCTGSADREGNMHYYIQTAPDNYSEAIRTSFRGLKQKHEVTILDFTKPQSYGLGQIIASQP